MDEVKELDAILATSSLLAGVFAPLLDKVLGQTIPRYLTWGLAAFEATFLNTGTLFILRFFFGLANLPILSNIFNFYATEHVLLLIPPMVRYTKGLETDIGFLRAMRLPEALLYFFLGPSMVVRMMKFMWSQSIIVVVFISVVGILVYCPTPLGNRVLHTTLLYLADFTQLCHEYDVTIRGLFLNAFNPLLPLSTSGKLQTAVGSESEGQDWNSTSTASWRKIETSGF
jgi:hypothetical protein